MNARPNVRQNARRKPSPDTDTHWARQRERGSLLWMRLGFGAARLLGRRVLTPVLWLVVAYFYACGRRARRAIAEYQGRLRQTAGQGADAAVPLPRCFPVYRQYLAFAQALLDKLDVWGGRIHPQDLTLHDPQALHTRMGGGQRGQILVTAHLGNADITRALAERVAGLRLNVLVHTRHAPHFNRLLDEAGASVRLIQVLDLNPALMLELAQRIDRGEWLAIAGDRVPLTGARTTEVDFLGGRARLPQGPWLLAALLGCPANLLLCLRTDGPGPARFRVVLERLLDAPDWPRRARARHIAASAQHYADRLAAHCRQAPRQWFNFYPFWTEQP